MKLKRDRLKEQYSKRWEDVAVVTNRVGILMENGTNLTYNALGKKFDLFYQEYMIICKTTTERFLDRFAFEDERMSFRMSHLSGEFPVAFLKQQ